MDAKQAASKQGFFQPPTKRIENWYDLLSSSFFRATLTHNITEFFRDPNTVTQKPTLIDFYFRQKQYIQYEPSREQTRDTVHTSNFNYEKFLHEQRTFLEKLPFRFPDNLNNDPRLTGSDLDYLKVVSSTDKEGPILALLYYVKYGKIREPGGNWSWFMDDIYELQKVYKRKSYLKDYANKFAQAVEAELHATSTQEYYEEYVDKHLLPKRKKLLLDAEDNQFGALSIGGLFVSVLTIVCAGAASIALIDKQQAAAAALFGLTGAIFIIGLAAIYLRYQSYSAPIRDNAEDASIKKEEITGFQNFLRDKKGVTLNGTL